MEISPLVYVVDDDEDFNTLIKRKLKKLGIDCVTFTSAHLFLKNLTRHKPSACLVDLNFGSQGSGFELLAAIRLLVGTEIPILVVSLKSDTVSIAHALEKGANDYIVKPIDTEVLATKLTEYIRSYALAENSLPFFEVPNKGAGALVTFDLQLEEIDELGVKLKSRHLLPKGTMLEISYSDLAKIIPKQKALYVTVASTSIDPDTGFYSVYAEFDLTNHELLRAVRYWLLNNESEYKDSSSHTS